MHFACAIYTRVCAYIIIYIYHIIIYKLYTMIAKLICNGKKELICLFVSNILQAFQFHYTLCHVSGKMLHYIDIYTMQLT